MFRRLLASETPPREVPDWVRRLVEGNNGDDIRFLLEKDLTESDVGRQQNRLLIPKQSVKRYLVPALTHSEREAAGLTDNDHRHHYNCDSNSSGGNYSRGGGLAVAAYTKAGWKFGLNIIRWNSSRACVVNGEDWRTILKLSGLTTSKRVQLWSFRTPACGCSDKKLNLVVGEATRLPSSS